MKQNFWFYIDCLLRLIGRHCMYVVDGIAIVIIWFFQLLLVIHFGMLIIILLAKSNLFMGWMSDYDLSWVYNWICKGRTWLEEGYIKDLQTEAKIWAEEHPEWTELFNDSWNLDALEDTSVFMGILTLDLAIIYAGLSCVFWIWKRITGR